ncbi:MAG: PEFG-CTERM sorting domain-containing protein, partial [Nitrososphaera sp.]
TVRDITADPESTTLLVDIESTDDGMLKIWLPTQVIDADDEYSVVIDGESGNFVVDELDPTADARVLQIEFPNGAQEVEIIGTFLVPEFGVIGAVILAIAVVGVIAATSYRNLPGLRTL